MPTKKCNKAWKQREKAQSKSSEVELAQSGGSFTTWQSPPPAVWLEAYRTQRNTSSDVTELPDTAP
jgi:hypothetical protein